MRVPCPQCGGAVPIREATGFPTCPFCAAALVLDRSGVRIHFLYRPRIAADQVLPVLRRWADRQGIRIAAAAGSASLIYHPFWRYTRSGPPRLVPGWSTLEVVWDGLRPPDAEVVCFDPALTAGAEVIEPTLPEASARFRALGGETGDPGELAHLPVYRTTVRVGDRPLELWIDACSGAVLSSGPVGPQAGAATAAGRTAWMAGGGVVMVMAAMAIPSAVLAACAVGVLSVALYIGLSAAGRERGA